MKPALCLVGLLAAAFVGELAAGSPALLVTTGLILLVAAVFIARGSAVDWLGTARTPCVLLFALAVVHIFVGYLVAGLTSDRISMRSNEGTFFATALLINAIGLLAGALGYGWFLRKETSADVPEFFERSNAAVASKVFTAILIGGTALMFYAYGKFGLADYLSDPAKWPFMRYITSDMFGGSAQDEWIVNRAMDLISVSLPAALFALTKRRSLFNILLVVAGSAALLLPLRRANLLAVVIIFLILVGIEKADIFRITRRVVFIAGALYLVSQFVFLMGVVEGDADPISVIAISSTALPEVRDLGWMLSLLNGESLNGVTFVQALVPIPSIASDWSTTHSLRAITTRYIGLDQSGQTGGLRLTIFGEAFINFGYLGTILIGFLWGAAVGWCERLLGATGRDKPPLANYCAALSFVWICFLVYLAGTQAGATIKFQSLMVLAIVLVSRHGASLPLPGAQSLTSEA